MPATEQDTTPGSSSQRKNRVQLDHVLIDVDFFDKPKIKAIDFKFGPLASTLLVRLYCDMSRATDAEIPVDCANAIAEAIRFEKFDEFLTYCITFDIIRYGSSKLFLTNSRILSDQENVAEKQDKWRTKRRQQRDRSETDRSALNSEIVNTEDLNTEENTNTKEVTRKGVQGETITPVAVQGKTERAPGVWVSDTEFETGVLEYSRADLNKAWAARGLLHTSRHLSQPKNAGKNAYVHWVTWALRECLNDKKAGLDAKTAKTRNENANKNSRNESRPLPQIINPRAVLPESLDSLVSLATPAATLSVGQK